MNIPLLALGIASILGAFIIGAKSKNKALTPPDNESITSESVAKSVPPSPDDEKGNHSAVDSPDSGGTGNAGDMVENQPQPEQMNDAQ